MQSIKFLLLSLFFALLLIPVKTSAQENSFLKNFYAYQINDKVIVKWTINQGNTCFGIKILRAADSVNFEEIGIIYGICGSNSSDEPFIFIDSFPIPNQVNYYKLDFGGQAPSDVISTEFINTGENDFFVDYKGKPRLLFLNPKQETVRLEVYNMNGKLMISSTTNWK